MGGGRARGKDERLAVPAMPMPLAVVCCVLNFLVPGLGTVVAGTSSFCCARNEDMDGSSRCGSCCIGLGIGFLQLLTTVTCLIGWVWSCVWGVFMIAMSAEYYHDNPPDGQGHPGATVAPVVNQPMSYGYHPPPVAYGPAPAYNTPGQYPPLQQYNTPGQYPSPPQYNTPGQYPPPPQYNTPGQYPPPPQYNTPGQYPPPPQYNTPEQYPPPQPYTPPPPYPGLPESTLPSSSTR
ncbi:calcium-binding protein P-like [Haliotis cracherodii]|uniref:calcium-binding protein P-like n=1 Tax=Haliotis cracherodii TaxID=6455 RepID=UPI0039E9875E